MQTASTIGLTRQRHSRHLHPAPKCQRYRKHSSRAVKHCESCRHTPRGAVFSTPTSPCHRGDNHITPLIAALNNRINQAKLTAEPDIENLIDRLMEDISLQGREINQYYGCNTPIREVLNRQLTKWRRRTIHALKGTYSSNILESLNTAMKNNFSVLIKSMEVIPPDSLVTTKDRAPPCVKDSVKNNRARHKKGTHGQTKFYVEKQQHGQCGRHSINAYYRKPVLKLHNKYENMEIQEIYNEMVTIEKRRKNPRPLVIFRYLLTEVDRFAYEKPTPTCFDEMPVRKMILTMPNHHVCFRRNSQGDWYLLDSLQGSPKKMAPSEYINSHRKRYSSSEILRHNQTEDHPNIAVICEDKGQDYPHLDVVNNRPVLF